MDKSETSTSKGQDALSKLKGLGKRKERKTFKTSRVVLFDRDPKTGLRVTKPKVHPKRKYTKKKKENASEISDLCDFVVNNDNLAACNSHQALSSSDSLSGEEPFLSCIELLKSLSNQKKSKYKRKTWFERTQSTQAEWEKERRKIWEVLLCRENLDGLCYVCKTREAKIKCLDCSDSHLCYLCDDITHRLNPLHDRLAFLDGFGRCLHPCEILNEKSEIEYSPKIPVLKFPVTQTCSACGKHNFAKHISEEKCIIITLKGRFDLHKYKLHCCECPSIIDPFTLSISLQSGFWPGSIGTINYLIDENVFFFWDAFRKRMPGSSERAFLMSLTDLAEANGRHGFISSMNFSMAFKEWNYWRRERNIIQAKNWLECPPCSIKQHGCHVDGNCKLYRYKQAKRKRTSYYENMFIASNTEVNKYLQTIPDYTGRNTQSTNNVCGGSWTAAKNIKRKGKSLDETGLEVAVCRHRVAQKAVNMFHGELFGYPLYIIKSFMVPKEVKFCFADVMCKLWKFIKRIEPGVSKAILPALSVMHAKGHSLDCQVTWSGEWLEGTARMTGEEGEQVFANMSRYGSTTKHQSPENREETITEMVFGWNQRKIYNIAQELRRRYYKNEDDIKTATAAYSKVMAEHSVKDEGVVIAWLHAIKTSAKGIRVTKWRTALSNAEKTLLLARDLEQDSFKDTLQHFNFPTLIQSPYRFLEFSKQDKQNEYNRLVVCGISEDLLKDAYKTLKKDVWKLIYEHTIEKLFMEKVVWGVNIHKTADTSKRRHILRAKQVTIVKNIKDILNEYCSMYDMNFDTVFPSCEKGEFPWAEKDVSYAGSATNRRRCVEAYILQKRLLEERSVLKHEASNCIKFYEQKLKALTEEYNILRTNISDDTSIENYENNNSDYSLSIESMKGKLALVCQGRYYYIKQLEIAISSFADILQLQHYHPVDNVDVLEGDQEDEQRCETVEPSELADLSDLSTEVIMNVGKDLADFSFNDCLVERNDYSLKLFLPTACCQSRLHGSDGSNACMLISLLVGYLICSTPRFALLEHISLTDVSLDDTKTLFLESLPLICGAMYTGNYLYETNECSGFLQIVEALNVMESSTLTFDLGIEVNLHGKDHGKHSIYQYFKELSQQCQTSDGSFIVFVTGFKAFCICPIGSNLFIFDSHSHDPYGGQIWKQNCDELLPTDVSQYDGVDVAYACTIRYAAKQNRI